MRFYITTALLALSLALCAQRRNSLDFKALERPINKYELTAYPVKLPS